MIVTETPNKGIITLLEPAINSTGFNLYCFLPTLNESIYALVALSIKPSSIIILIFLPSLLPLLKFATSSMVS